MKNLINISSLVLVISFISLFSCNSNDESGKSNPTNYDEITKSDIEVIADSMSSNDIEATNSNGHVLDVGDVIVYKTRNNHFGKMEILAIDDATNYKLTIKAVTYNLNDSGIFSQSSSLEIRGTWLGDLELMSETSVSSDADFQWSRETATDTSLSSYNGSAFSVYNF
ncbi:MAG TPA: hypothetical protein ENK67_02340 [Flavobacteriia bacterium]|nr:hypothetical protein [Flavobacteriia bacterium]